MNIIDTVKGAGIKAAIGFFELLYPSAKPEIDVIQKDIADGKITEENFEETFDTSLTFIEGFTDDDTDVILEQTKVAAHELIKLETMIREKAKR